MSNLQPESLKPKNNQTCAQSSGAHSIYTSMTQHDQKSVNIQYLYDGLLRRWNKRIMDQETDVARILFVVLFTDFGHSKRFIFIF